MCNLIKTFQSQNFIHGKTEYEINNNNVLSIRMHFYLSLTIWTLKYKSQQMIYWHIIIINENASNNWLNSLIIYKVPY